MSRVSGEYPSLINGVSQQTVAFRQPTQGSLSRNFYPTLVNGNKKRPPTETVAKLISSSTDLPTAFMHVIDRDETEQYVAVFSGTNSVRVFDFAGNEKTVSVTTSGQNYLSTATDKTTDLRAVSIADYTFVTNRKKVVQMDTVLSPVRNPEALVNIRQGIYGRTYSIWINGGQYASYTAPNGSVATDAPLIDVNYIAAILINQLVTNLTSAGFAFGLYNSVIHIQRTSNTDFAIEVRDGADGTATRAVKGAVQQITDLPRYGPAGFVVEVANSSTTSLDNFYVKSDRGASASSVVIWRETMAPGIKLQPLASTMPHTLVRNSDGTFTFKEAAWDSRKSGNGTSLGPDPSFIGSTITDITLFRQRLAFLSDESVIFSKSNSYFDFFRTTAIATLDEDPIDVSVSHTKVSILQHALPHQDSLFLFSDKTQFRVGLTDIFSPKTAAIKAITEFSCSTKVRPISVGSKAYFLSEDIPNNLDSFTSVYEMSMDNAYQTIDVSKTTAHVPSYIPGGAVSMTGSADEHMLFVKTKGSASDTLYVHRWFWAGQDKIQSAWVEWWFPGAEVLATKCINSVLFLLMKRGTGLFLERIRLNPDETELDLPYQLCLDRKARVTSGGSYDAIANTTTYLFIYNQDTDVKAVSVQAGTDFVSERQVLGVAGGYVILKGNTTAQTVYFGLAYAAEYEFTQPVYRGRPNSGSTAIPTGRLQVQTFSVSYDRTGYFQLIVSTAGREDNVKTFQNRVVGDPSLKVGVSALQSGRMATQVLSNTDDCTISLFSDSVLPCAFLSASWDGIWNGYSRQA